jgi:hypothetical protein
MATSGVLAQTATLAFRGLEEPNGEVSANPAMQSRALDEAFRLKGQNISGRAAAPGVSALERGNTLLTGNDQPCARASSKIEHANSFQLVTPQLDVTQTGADDEQRCIRSECALFPSNLVCR